MNKIDSTTATKWRNLTVRYARTLALAEALQTQMREMIEPHLTPEQAREMRDDWSGDGSVPLVSGMKPSMRDEIAFWKEACK